MPRLKDLDILPLLPALGAALFAMRFDARSVFALPKLQAVAIVLVILLIVSVVRAHRGRISPLPSEAAVALAAFGLWSVVCTLTAVDARTAFFGSDGTVMGFVSYVCGFVVFALAATWFHDIRSIERYLQLQVSLVAIVALHAIGQYYGVFESLYSGDAQIDGVARVLGRPAATIGHPVALGAILGSSLPFAATFAIDAPTRGQRMWWTIVTAVLGAALLVSESRGPWIGSACGAVVLLGLRRIRRTTPVAWAANRWRVGALAAAVLASLIVLVAADVARGGALPRRIKSFAALRQDGSLLNRFPLYRAALRMIRDRPVVGGGFDTFATLYPRYRERESASMPADVMPGAPHNGALQLAAATGIPGLAAYAGLLVIVFRRLLRSGSPPPQHASITAACAASIAAFLVQDLTGWSQLALHVYFWLVLGIAVAVTSVDEPSRARRAPRVLGFGGAVLAGVVLTVAAVRTSERLAADAALFRAQGMAAHDWVTAESWLDAAVAYAKRVPSVYDAAGVMYLQRVPVTRDETTYRTAAALLDRASSAFPLDPYPRIHRVDLDTIAIRARVLTAPSADAMNSERHAAELDPNNASVYESSARLRLAARDFDGAERFTARVVDLRPEHPRTLELRGDLLWAQSRREPAADAYRDAVRRAAPDSSIWLACQRKLVMVQLESGHPAAAVDRARQAIRTRPSDSLLHTLLGAGYERVGTHADAVAAYERALALDGRNVDAASALRRLHAREERQP